MNVTPVPGHCGVQPAIQDLVGSLDEYSDERFYKGGIVYNCLILFVLFMLFCLLESLAVAAAMGNPQSPSTGVTKTKWFPEQRQGAPVFFS